MELLPGLNKQEISTILNNSENAGANWIHFGMINLRGKYYTARYRLALRANVTSKNRRGPQTPRALDVVSANVGILPTLRSVDVGFFSCFI